jgi:hypothetical protein
VDVVSGVKSLLLKIENHRLLIKKTRNSKNMYWFKRFKQKFEHKVNFT